MRVVMTMALATACALLSCRALKADYVPPFKGNDTGGIISYSLASEIDAKALAIDHCAKYGKVVKITGVQAYYGGYLSFACIWVPPGRAGHPIRVRY